MLIAVSVDEPLKRSGYYGAQVAAPVFKRIAERAANFLNIKPDVTPAAPQDVPGTGQVRSAVAQVREKN